LIGHSEIEPQYVLAAQTANRSVNVSLAAYLAAGQGKESASEFQKIIDRSGIVWNCWTGALAHLGVARADALQARTSQGVDADSARVRALAAYKDFLTLWKEAAPQHPHLQASRGGNTRSCSSWSRSYAVRLVTAW